MSQFREVEILRKISRISVLSNKYEEKRKSLSPYYIEPKDPFFVVHITSFFLGFMNLMPVMFFAFANNYWMFKFRDPATQGENTDGVDRTPLQQYFQSVSMIVLTVPPTFVSILLMVCSKVSNTWRTIISLFFMGVNFGVMTVFTRVNTDSWQTNFFILTMFLIFINSIFLSSVQSVSIALMAKLPQEYLYYFIIGQNGTLFISILQIICLSVTKSNSTAAFIYFLVGTFLIFLTLGLLLISKQTELYKHYIEDTENIEEPKLLTVSLLVYIFKKVWPTLFVIGTVMFNLSSVYPSLSSLVVSQYEYTKSDWNVKYFVPVTVFLINDIFCTIGKLLSKNARITKSNKYWYIIPSFLLCFIFSPFYMYCNAQPRHLPVIFDQDWMFITVNIIFALIAGFLINVSIMSLKPLAEDNEEGSYSLMNLWISFINTVFCSNGLILVSLIKNN